MLDHCGVKRIQNKLVASNEKHGSGAQEKSSTGWTENYQH